MNFSKGEYVRCDAKSCDTYSANISHNGIWYTIDLPGRSMFAKLSDSGVFVEVVSLNDLIWSAMASVPQDNEAATTPLLTLA